MTKEVVLPFGLWSRIMLCVGIAIEQDPKLIGEILDELDRLDTDVAVIYGR